MHAIIQKCRNFTSFMLVFSENDAHLTLNASGHAPMGCSEFGRIKFDFGCINWWKINVVHATVAHPAALKTRASCTVSHLSVWYKSKLKLLFSPIL